MNDRFRPVADVPPDWQNRKMEVTPGQRGRGNREIVLGAALTSWTALSLAAWGFFGIAALLGDAMAEPPGRDADFTVLYFVIAAVCLLFVGWCAATWALFRKAPPSTRWLALLAAIPLIALLLR